MTLKWKDNQNTCMSIIKCKFCMIRVKVHIKCVNMFSYAIGSLRSYFKTGRNRRTSVYLMTEPTLKWINFLYMCQQFLTRPYILELTSFSMGDCKWIPVRGVEYIITTSKFFKQCAIIPQHSLYICLARWLGIEAVSPLKNILEHTVHIWTEIHCNIPHMHLQKHLQLHSKVSEGLLLQSFPNASMSLL